MAYTTLPAGTTIVNGNLVIPVGNNDIATGNLKIRVKAVAGVNNAGGELFSNAPFTVSGSPPPATAPYATRFRFIDDNHIGMTTNEPVTLGSTAGYTFTGNGAAITPSTFSGSGSTEIVFAFSNSLAGLAVTVAYDQATGNTINAAGIELLPFEPTPFTVGHSWVRLIDEFAGTAATDILDHTPDEGTKWSGKRGELALDGSGSLYPLVNNAFTSNYVEKGYDNVHIRITGSAYDVFTPVYYRINGAEWIYVQYNRHPTPGVDGTLHIIQVIGGVGTEIGKVSAPDMVDYSLKVYHNSASPGEIRAHITNGTIASPDAVGTTTIPHGNTTRFGFQLPIGAKISRAYAGIGIDPLT